MGNLKWAIYKMFNLVKNNFFILLFSFLILYFLINLLDGNRGLISYLEKKKMLFELNKIEANLTDEVSDLQHKNSLLSKNIDLDYIETLIRDKFIYGKIKENIYIIQNESIKN